MLFIKNINIIVVMCLDSEPVLSCSTKIIDNDNVKSTQLEQKWVVNLNID